MLSVKTYGHGIHLVGVVELFSGLVRQVDILRGNGEDLVLYVKVDLIARLVCVKDDAAQCRQQLVAAHLDDVWVIDRDDGIVIGIF